MGDKVSSEDMFERFLVLKNREKEIYDGDSTASKRIMGSSSRVKNDETSKKLLEKVKNSPDLQWLRESAIQGIVHERVRLHRYLVEALKRLPEAERDILFCMYYKGMTLNETAEYLKKSSVWVRMKRKRAFARLDAIGDVEW